MKLHLVVFTINQSAPFLKQEINKIEGYEAFSKSKWPTADLIYCTLPRAATAILPDLAAQFAAGTFRGPGSYPPESLETPGATSSYRVHLKLDDEAFQWLKKKSWTSYIGLFMVRWEHDIFIDIVHNSISDKTPTSMEPVGKVDCLKNTV